MICLCISNWARDRKMGKMIHSLHIASRFWRYWTGVYCYFHHSLCWATYSLQFGILPKSWGSQWYHLRILAISNNAFLELSWCNLLKTKNVKLFLQTPRHCSKRSNGNWCNIDLFLPEMPKLDLQVLISCDLFMFCLLHISIPIKLMFWLYETLVSNWAFMHLLRQQDEKWGESKWQEW